MTVFLFCLKLEMDTNGVFVPRYAGKIFIDHWTLLGQTHSLQIWIGKRNRTQRFVLTFFSLHGPQRLRLLALAAGLARLPFESAVSNDRRRTTHIFGFVANPFWSPCFCYSGRRAQSASVGARSGQATVFHWYVFIFLALVLRVNSVL